MRKGGKYSKIQPKPDYKYNRIDIGRFINYIMKQGKKSVAEKVFYNALGEVEKKTKQNPLDVFGKAMENASPSVEIASRRVGGANYQIPVEVREERRFYLGAKWIIKAARGKKGRPMELRLADEIIAASKNEGDAIKKKQDTHRVAEANRAFASFLRR